MNIIINKHKYIIRKCLDSDYSFTFNLTKRNMKRYLDQTKDIWDENIYKNNFKKNLTRIIENKGLRIGFFSIRIHNNFIYINEIQISKKFQDQGIGTKIIGLIEDIALSKKINIIKLHSFTDNPSVKLYEKLGYRITKKNINIYSLRKDLNRK